jgi:Icc-related predicted phosphoesterase
MTTRNIVCSDVHDDLAALSAVVDYAAAQQVDRILFLGDFSLRPYTPEHLEKLARSPGSEADIAQFIANKRAHNSRLLLEAKKVLYRSGLPYFVVPGNYDPDLREIFGERDLHNQTSIFGEARVLGYGGADAFPQHIAFLNRFGEIVEYDQNKLFSFLSREEPEIVIAHNPPFRLCDDMFNGQNVGSRALTQHILETSPKIVLSGHIHEAGFYGNNPHGVNGIAKVTSPSTGLDTIVINPGNLGRFELVSFPSLETAMKFPYGTFGELTLEDDGTPKRVKAYTLETEDRGVGEVRKIGDYSL